MLTNHDNNGIIIEAVKGSEERLTVRFKEAM